MEQKLNKGEIKQKKVPKSDMQFLIDVNVGSTLSTYDVCVLIWKILRFTKYRRTIVMEIRFLFKYQTVIQMGIECCDKINHLKGIFIDV